MTATTRNSVNAAITRISTFARTVGTNMEPSQIARKLHKLKLSGDGMVQIYQTITRGSAREILEKDVILKNNVTVSIPSLCDMTEQWMEPDCIEKDIITEVSVFNKNPYDTIQSSSKLCKTCPVVAISISDSKGNEIRVNEARKPITLHIPIADSGAHSETMTITSHTSSKRQFHVVDIDDVDDVSLLISFKPLNENHNNRFCIFLAHKRRPTAKDFDEAFLYHKEGMDYNGFTQFVSHKIDDDKKGKQYITVYEVVDVNRAAHLDTAEVKVEISGKEDTYVVKDTRLSSSYEISVKAAACYYYNVIADYWPTHGCTVGQITTYNKIQCLCDHLTMFGSSSTYKALATEEDSYTSQMSSSLTSNELYLIIGICALALGILVTAAVLLKVKTNNHLSKVNFQVMWNQGAKNMIWPGAKDGKNSRLSVSNPRDVVTLRHQMYIKDTDIQQPEISQAAQVDMKEINQNGFHS